MSIITLTTDYGLKDHFVGALKGKIVSILPETSIIDISHDIDPFNIAEASYIINAAYKSFPKNTVHIIGVDSERSIENDHIAIQWNDQYFIAGDNGILSILTQNMAPQKIVVINIHEKLEADANDLDVFVMVATHLAKGGSLSVIGKEKTNLKAITNLQPTIAPDNSYIKGNVIYIDHFGNLVVNITKKLFLEVAKGRPYEIAFKTKPLKTILPSYTSVAASGEYPMKYFEGHKLAIFNESGFLEIAIFRSNPTSVGSASSLLGLGYRDIITINFK